MISFIASFVGLSDRIPAHRITSPQGGEVESTVTANYKWRERIPFIKTYWIDVHGKFNIWGATGEDRSASKKLSETGQLSRGQIFLQLLGTSNNLKNPPTELLASCPTFGAQGYLFCCVLLEPKGMLEGFHIFVNSNKWTFIQRYCTRIFPQTKKCILFDNFDGIHKLRQHSHHPRTAIDTGNHGIPSALP